MLKGVRDRDYLIMKRMLLLLQVKENFLYGKDEKRKEDCLAGQKGKLLLQGEESYCCFSVQEGQETEAQVSMLTQRTQVKNISWGFLNSAVFTK